jgi:pyruvate/2-oxoacid:ferredoxin oxidoreductase alpha subunit
MKGGKTGAVRVMAGNEACAEAALAAGVMFFAGYPITPSSEIAEELAAELPKRGGVFLQMEDEIGAMGAVVGASLTGLKAMTATSGPGFSLKQENLGFACMTEVPCVVVNVQRGGPSTGLPTMPAQGDVMQARWGTHGDHPIIALAPYSVAETFDLTVRAFNLAETYRSPVILLLDEIIGHVNEKITLPDRASLTITERKKPTVPPEEYNPYEHTDDGIPPTTLWTWSLSSATTRRSLCLPMGPWPAQHARPSARLASAGSRWGCCDRAPSGPSRTERYGLWLSACRRSSFPSSTSDSWRTRSSGQSKGPAQ